MRVAVTGGAGFLGGRLASRLVAEGHEVDVVDDLSTGSLANLAEARAGGGLHFHQLDVRAPALAELLERRRPEVVFHLAWRPLDDPADDADLTVGGTLQVLAGAARAGARKLVHAGDAVALYGVPERRALPVRESRPPAPVDHHGVSCWAAVEHLRIARLRLGLEFTSLALATVYGPGDRRGPVRRAVDDALAGRTIAADGPTLDLVYVDDAVDAFVRAAARGSGLVCNVGSGRETTPAELGRVLATRTGFPDVAPRPARAGSRFCLDVTRARIHLGWEPWTTLEEGVGEVCRWLEARPPVPDPPPAADPPPAPDPDANRVQGSPDPGDTRTGFA
jgi:UDP-glucose 4-epimerase